MFPPVKRQVKGKQFYGIKHAPDSIEGAISDVFLCQRGLAPWLRGLKDDQVRAGRWGREVVGVFENLD